jgi:UDP-glucose 4-epimerase
MNWLITGGCGFLGTSLIKYLLRNNTNKIRVIDNLSMGSLKDLNQVCTYSNSNITELDYSNSKVQFVKGDILDFNLALEVVKDSDVVVHFAANTGVGPSVVSPRHDMMLNVVGTFNYLEASRHHSIKRFIFASSGAPAGEIEPPIHEEIPPHPVSPYGASKLAGEGYCSAYKNTFAIDTVVLRFGNVYGPGSLHKESVVAKFIRSALNGEVLEIFGDGSQTRDFIYIDDLVNAVVLAANKQDVGGEIFQIASNKETTVSEISDILGTLLIERGIKKVRIIRSAIRTGDVMRNYSDTSKALNMLGWKAETDLWLGLSQTVDYFLNLSKET